MRIGTEPGLVAEVIEHGAALQSLHVTCGDGERRNVVLGYALPAKYQSDTNCLGATPGRYANRIARGRFEFDGRVIQLDTNNHGNHLHGGTDGFHHRMWSVVDHDDTHVLFSLTSADGDQGYPGALTATVRYSVSGNELLIELAATTDAPTIVNLTNHSYFNLDGCGPGGEDAGLVDTLALRVNADRYTPTDEHGIPLNGHADVAGTRFDLRDPQSLAARVFDHNYVLTDQSAAAAVLTSPATRTSVQVWTDQPGLQVYTGENLTTGARRGIALEAELPPDTPNHPDFGSARLAPGETYTSQIRFVFGSADPS